MDMRKYPEAIKTTGNEKEMFFLERRIEGNKEIRTLMKAGNDGVQDATMVHMAGGVFPVYIKLLQTYIYTGKAARLF